jgi:hypothetical protein
MSVFHRNFEKFLYPRLGWPKFFKYLSFRREFNFMCDYERITSVSSANKKIWSFKF